MYSLPGFIPYFAAEEVLHGTTLPQDPKADYIFLPHHLPDGSVYYRLRFAREGTEPAQREQFEGERLDPSKVRGLYKARGMLWEQAHTTGSLGFPRLPSNPTQGELYVRACLEKAESAQTEDSEIFCLQAFHCMETPDVWTTLGCILGARGEYAECVDAVGRGWQLAETWVDFYPWSEEKRFIRPAIHAATAAYALQNFERAETFARRGLEKATGAARNALLRLKENAERKRGTQAQLSFGARIAQPRLRPLWDALYSAGFVANRSGCYLMTEPGEIPENEVGIAVLADGVPPLDEKTLRWLRDVKAVFALSHVDAKGLKECSPWLSAKLHVMPWGIDRIEAEKGEAYCDVAGDTASIPAFLQAQAEGRIPITRAGTSCAEYMTQGFLFRGLEGLPELDRAVQARVESINRNQKESREQGRGIAAATYAKYRWDVVAHVWGKVLSLVIA